MINDYCEILQVSLFIIQNFGFNLWSRHGWCLPWEEMISRRGHAWTGNFDAHYFWYKAKRVIYAWANTLFCYAAYHFLHGATDHLGLLTTLGIPESRICSCFDIVLKTNIYTYAIVYIFKITVLIIIILLYEYHYQQYFRVIHSLCPSFAFVFIRLTCIFNICIYIVHM